MGSVLLSSHTHTCKQMYERGHWRSGWIWWQPRSERAFFLKCLIISVQLCFSARKQLCPTFVFTALPWKKSAHAARFRIAQKCTYANSDFSWNRWRRTPNTFEFGWNSKTPIGSGIATFVDFTAAAATVHQNPISPKSDAAKILSFQRCNSVQIV